LASVGVALLAARRANLALLTTSKDWTGGKQQLTATRLHDY